MAGLTEFSDVNDLGFCAIRVRVDLSGQQIATVENRAAAVLTPDGQVLNLDNLIPAGEPWDLLRAARINNRGQVIGIGIKNGVRIARPFLLTPNATLTGYDLTDLGVDGVSGSVSSLNEQGDALVYFGDGSRVIRFADGTTLPVGLDGTGYEHFGSTQMLFGRFADGLYPSTRFLKAELNGNVYPLRFIASNAYNHWNVEVAENGYSAALEQVPTVKVKGANRRMDYFVTHDPWGNVTKIDLPASIEPGFFVKVNSQIVGGVPLAVGTELNSNPIHIMSWIRFPGFVACRFRDLMAPAMQQQYDEALPNLYESGMLTTPRNLDGSINHAGAPSIFGLAYPEGNTTGLPLYGGIYVLSPTLD